MKYKQATYKELSNKKNDEQNLALAKTISLFKRCLRRALETTDVLYHTLLRTLQVFSNVTANHSNTDKHNPNSLYYQTVEGGGKHAGPTPMSWALGVGVIFPLAIGAIVEYQKIKHEYELKTKEYLLKALQEARERYFGPGDFDIDLEALNKKIDDVQNALFVRYQKQRAYDSNIVISDNEIEEAVNKKLAEERPLTFFILDKKKHPNVQKFAKLYDLIGSTAGFYWLTWMSTVTVIGLTAVLLAPALPYVAFAAIGISVVINGSFAILNSLVSNKRVINSLSRFKKTANDNRVDAFVESLLKKMASCLIFLLKVTNDIFNIKPHNTIISRLTRFRDEASIHLFGSFLQLIANRLIKAISEKPIPKDSLHEHIESEIHLRVLMKNEHLDFKIKLQQTLYNLAAYRNKKTYAHYFGKIYGLKQYKSIAEIEKECNHERPQDLFTEKSRLKNLNLKRFVKIAVGVLSHATMMFFILWLASATFAGIAFVAPASAFILASVATLLTNATVNIVAAAVGGIIGGTLSYVNFTKTQLALEEKMTRIAGSKYKPEKIAKKDFLETTNKQHAVNVLYLRTQQQTKHISHVQQTLKKLRAERARYGTKIAPALQEAEQFILDYNLKSKDVNNDYYPEKLKIAPSNWSQFKKKISRFFTFLGGSQTGIYNARNLGLQDGLLAPHISSFGNRIFGPVSGAYYAFMGVTGIFGILGGLLKITEYFTDKEMKREALFINHIDARLSGLKKRYVELDAIEKLVKLIHIEKPRVKGQARAHKLAASHETVAKTQAYAPPKLPTHTTLFSNKPAPTDANHPSAKVVPLI